MKNILFIRSDRFGEFMLSLPAVRLARLKHPESKIYLLARKENGELIKDVDFIDSFLEYKEDVFSGYRGALRLAGVLRRERIETIVVLNPKKEFNLASFLAGVKWRVGYDRKWGFLLNRKIKDKKLLEKKHEAEYNIDLVSLICEDAFIPAIDLPVDKPASLKFLGSSLGESCPRGFFVLHPFTSNPAKKIGIEFWERLVQEVKTKFGEGVVMIGSPAEVPEAEILAEKLKVENITGRLTLRNLAAFLKYRCRIFIGLDSGPLHLASILKRPTVALFKATNPLRWGPFRTESLVLKEKGPEDFSAKVPYIMNFIENIEVKKDE